MIRQSPGTYRKYAIFFVFLSFLFSGVSIVNAAQQSSGISNDVSGGDISVSATVPLSREFVYAIRKNSVVVPDKKAFVVGEEGEIIVHIRGGKGEPLKNHRVVARIFNVHGEEIVFTEGTTDISGDVRFRLKLSSQFLGENSVSVTDTAYDESLDLFQKLSFIVYETNDAKERALKEAEKGVSAEIVTIDTPFFGLRAVPVDDFYQKNATIGTYRSIEKLSRGSPP